MGPAPRLLLLQVEDPMAAAAEGGARGPHRPGEADLVPAAYARAGAEIGQHLAALVARLEEATLHVPLHLFGSAVREGAAIAPPVELRAVLPTVLARAGAVLPVGVEPLDLLSDDPTAWGEGLAYAEVGDMFALRKGGWLLRYRAMIDRGSALNPDLTTFLQHPLAQDRPSEDDARFYSLFDPTEASGHLREHSKREWPTVLALRDAMIAVRTGPAASAPQALDPAHLLELRMTAAQGYW